jgi:hypothetical protein
LEFHVIGDAGRSGACHVEVFRRAEPGR